MANQIFPMEQFTIFNEKIKLDPYNPPHLQTNDFWTKEEIIKYFGSMCICYQNNITLTFYNQFGGYLGVIQNFDKVSSSLKHINSGKKIYVISFMKDI